MTEADKWLMNPIKNTIMKHVLKKSLNNMSIEKTRLGHIVSALGATILVLEEILHNKHHKKIQLSRQSPAGRAQSA